MKTGFVFDLDGTLVDSLPGIAAGLNLALVSMGMRRHSEESIRAMVGRGARELCRSALLASLDHDPSAVNDELIETLLGAFMKEYPQTWQQGTIVFPGIKELLIDLKRAKFPLGVLSNKPHVVTEPLVKHLFPDTEFDIVMGYSKQFPRKPNPTSLLYIAEQFKLASDKITLIGDSKHDAETAVSTKCGLLLVGWGYSIRAELEEYKVPVCDSVPELRQHVLSRSS